METCNTRVKTFWGIKGDEELMDKRKKKTTWKKERGFFKEGALIFFSPTMTMMEKYLN